MLAAGLLAKKAVERGLQRRSGGENFARAGFARRDGLSERRPVCNHISISSVSILVGYGCTTCIGNSGPLHPTIEKAIHE